MSTSNLPVSLDHGLRLLGCVEVLHSEGTDIAA
jgi:hypothetical protein